MHRISLLKLVVALVIGALLVPLSPARQVAVATGPTFLVVENEYQPGSSYYEDYVAPDDIISGSGAASAANVTATRPNAGVTQVEFSAPTGGTLAVGTYTGALATATDTHPGLNVIVNNSGCSLTDGSFEVFVAPEADGQGHLTAFAASFTATCGSYVRQGVVAINSTPPIAVFTTAPTTLTFGTVTIGQAGSTLPVTVTNLGGAAGSITGATTSGTNAASFGASNGCTSVAAGASCTVDVTFAPRWIYQNAAELVLSSAGWHLPRRFLLQGTGSVAAATNGTPATAVVIGSLPFVHGADVSALPLVGGYCNGGEQSIWYRYTTPVLRKLDLSTATSNTATNIAILKGTTSSMTLVGCGANNAASFTAQPNVTYFINVIKTYPGGSALVLQAVEGTPDTVVEAGSFSLQYSTFYPYKDGYRDTVAIKGSRQEIASVGVSIYNADGKRVRALSVASGTGAYSIAWNGKNSAGTLQPSGKYKVVQTVTDLWGNKLSDTRYVTLSRKVLYKYTYSKTRHGADYVASGKSGTATITKSGSAYAYGVKLSSGSNGAAAVAYTFTVPSASVYLSMSWKVLGKGSMMTSSIGLQDWTRCSTFDDSCVDPWGSGPINYSWASQWGSVKRNISATRVVRGYIEAATISGNSIKVDVDDVRLVVVYGILK